LAPLLLVAPIIELTDPPSTLVLGALASVVGAPASVLGASDVGLVGLEASLVVLLPELVEPGVDEEPEPFVAVEPGVDEELEPLPFEPVDGLAVDPEVGEDPGVELVEPSVVEPEADEEPAVEPVDGLAVEPDVGEDPGVEFGSDPV
jgi:hypothetical protein